MKNRLIICFIGFVFLLSFLSIQQNEEIEYFDDERTIIAPEPAGIGLNYSSYLGATGADNIQDIFVDDQGYIYTVGHSGSTDLYLTPNKLNSSVGSDDLWVMKLSPDGSQILYSTLLGGTSTEEAANIFVDTTGIYVTGKTYSSNFPTTLGAYDRVLSGSTEMFVCKITLDGSILLFSTLLGGSTGDDSIRDFVVDSAGAIYLTGLALSNNFPITSGANDTTFEGGSEGFITKLSSDGKTLLYSSFIGSSSADETYCIQLQSENITYIAGSTQSAAFPTTVGAYDRSHNGGNDIFFLCYNLTSMNFTFSTFVGGSGSDYPTSFQVDSGNNYIITGMTASTNFPTTLGAFDINANGGDDIFVTKLSPNVSQLLNSTYLGGSNTELCQSLVISNNFIYIHGNTNSNNFNLTSNAFDSIFAGTTERFLSRLTLDCSNLNYSTYIGGSDADSNNGLSTLVVKNSLVYLSGYFKSTDMYTTANAINKTHNPGNINDGFLLIMDFDLPEIITHPPSVPIIDNIDSPDTDGIYNISWSNSVGATIYSLYRSNTNFSTIFGLSAIYTGTINSYLEEIETNGNYYYAVIASNSSGSSTLSNRIVVDVQIIINATWIKIRPNTRNLNITGKMVASISTNKEIRVKMTSFSDICPISSQLLSGREYWAFEVENKNDAIVTVALKFYYSTSDLTNDQEKTLKLYGYSSDGTWIEQVASQDLVEHKFVLQYTGIQYYAVKMVNNNENDFSIDGYIWFDLLGLTAIFISIKAKAIFKKLH